MRTQLRRSIVVSASAVAATLLLSVSVPRVALAQQSVERVEITGSSIKRIEGETSLPVQVINRQELEQSGATNVEQFLQSVGVALQGNNNSVAATASGAVSGGVSGISLRGLGSQRTLVLIDGKRVSAGGTLTDSTTVDINLIPLQAVERVEILKDGASAVYGSEAIAGVINFILRKDYKGGEVGAYGAYTEHSGGRGWGVNGLLGLGDMATKGWNLTLTLDHRHEDAIFGAQRPFASSSVQPLAKDSTGVISFVDHTSGNTFPANISIPGVVGSRNPTNPACPGPYAMRDTVGDSIFGSTVCRFDPSPLVSLIPKTDLTGLFGSGRFRLTSEHEAYGQLGYTYKESQTVIQPVPISDQFALPPNHPLFNVAPYNGFDTFLLKSTSPYYPAAFIASQGGVGNPDVKVRFRSAVTGNRDVTDITDFWRAVGGVRGTLVGWDYDASLLHVQTTLRERVNNGYPSLQAILPLLNSGVVNPFGPNNPALTPNTPALIEATQFHGDAYKTKTAVDSAQLKGSRDLTRLPGGPLAVAVGVEGRRETFTLDTPPIIQIGDISGYGGNFLPVDKRRNVGSAFTEVNVPVVRTVELLAAARYDNYENTGSRTSPKIGARWQPIRQVLFRGSWSRGFRAPSLTELYQPQTIGVTAPGLKDPARCSVTGSLLDCGTQFPITLGGNQTLQPEISKNRSIGFVLEPINNLSFGVDYWEVELSNTIIFGIDPQFILNNPGQFSSLVTRAAPDTTGPCGPPTNCPGQVLSIVQTNQNLGQTHIRGFDTNALWRIPAGSLGTFTIKFDGTYMYRYDIQNLDGTYTSFNAQASPITNGSGGVIPRWRHYMTVDWRLSAWNFAGIWQYQRRYRDLVGNFEDTTLPGYTPRYVSDYSLFHVYASYTGLFSKNLKLTLGIRNVFDQNPPYSAVGGANYFQGGYDPGYADPRGRTVIFQGQYRF
jgi:iron complex outermembrane receptor protein